MFDVKDLGELRYFLGIQIERSRERIVIFFWNGNSRATRLAVQEIHTDKQSKKENKNNKVGKGECQTSNLEDKNSKATGRKSNFFPIKQDKYYRNSSKDRKDGHPRATVNLILSIKMSLLEMNCNMLAKIYPWSTERNKVVRSKTCRYSYWAASWY